MGEPRVSAQTSSGAIRRLALGTAQFGLSYGVANQSGQVAQGAVAAILGRAALAGVDTLDTAVAYGVSESALGAAGVSSWRVISKLPALPSGETDIGEWVGNQVRASLERLRVAQLEALLLHRPADLLSPFSTEYRRALYSLKEQGTVRALGISIYDPGELEQLWPLWQPDIVQAPFNVLDRRLLTSGWLARLQDRGVRIHVRSVFLQGLLLMRGIARPPAFERWRPLLDEWLAWCEQSGTQPLRAAVAFVSRQPEIERYVIGVDSLPQLEEVLDALVAPSSVPPSHLMSDDRDLLEPSRWKLT
jgi:aryl-alcohol dehydrogenase-like predicted oxidoreductase